MNADEMQRLADVVAAVEATPGWDWQIRFDFVRGGPGRYFADVSNRGCGPGNGPVRFIAVADAAHSALEMALAQKTFLMGEGLHSRSSICTRPDDDPRQGQNRPLAVVSTNVIHGAKHEVPP
jgi:hypothetical protein